MSKKARANSLENIFVSETHRIIYNEISYLKRRIHLVEGERKANYESNEEILKKNEVSVNEIKEINIRLKAERKTMLQSKELFVKEISLRLGGEKKAYEFKDKKFEDVVDILGCKIGTLRNKQNYLKYTKAQQAQLMRKVIEEEESMQKLVEGKVPKKRRQHSVQKRLDAIKFTETATSAMMMKITEADNIRSRYKNMISLLKSENFTLNIRVGENDKKLNTDAAEIDRIRHVLQDSLKAKKMAKKRLTEIEETTIKDYSAREHHLYESRLRLKTIREKMEQIGSKLSFPKFHMIHRDSSVADGLYVGYTASDDKREGKSATVVETVYADLSVMIGESDPTLIVLRFQEQRTHACELLIQEDTAKSAVRKEKLRKRFLLDKLSQLQYSGGLKREKLNDRTSRINQEMSSTALETDRLNKWLEFHTKIMDQMLSKLNEICINNDFKIHPQALSSEVPCENVVTLLKLVLKQLETLLGAGGGSSFSFSPTPAPGGNETDVGSLLPFEITAEGPSIFNLPSPVGSTTSYLADTEAGGGYGGPTVDHLSASASDILPLGSLRDRAPSIVLQLQHEGGPGGRSSSQLLEITTVDPQLHREESGSGVRKGKTGGGRKDSSEEEEAVTRNFVKRQSQILFEAKTRKGRFNSGGGSSGGGGGSGSGGGTGTASHLKS